MGKFSTAQLQASMDQRRPPAAIERDMKSTILGQLAQESDAPISIPLASIVTSPYQCRAAFVEEDIETLAESIADMGVLTPIIVRKVGESYELITGHKRTAACRKLGRDTIPALVRELSDHAAARALTADNTLHKTLTDWELYKHAAMLLDGGHVRNKKELESVFGMSHATVFNVLAFGDLPPEARALLDANPSLIGGTVAFALKDASKTTPELVVEACKLVAGGKLKQSAIKQWIAGHHATVARKAPAARHEFAIGDVAAPMRLVIVGADVRMTGVELDAEKLAELIRTNFDALKKSGS